MGVWGERNPSVRVLVTFVLSKVTWGFGAASRPNKSSLFPPLKKWRIPHPVRGGLLPIVASRTDYTPISFKDLQRKTIKPRKKSSDFFRKGETKENPQGGVNAAAGFELVSTRSSREDCLANLLGFAVYPNELRRAIARNWVSKGKAFKPKCRSGLRAEPLIISRH